MAICHHATNALTKEQCNDLFYFNKAMLLFSQSNGGVLHAGDLLSQHLLVVGGAVGIYPLEFTTQGEIGNTNSRYSIQRRFDILTDENYVSQESATLLQAISFCTKESVMYAENLCCKEVQQNDSHTNNRWKDSFYKEQSALYNVILSKSNILSLHKYTSLDTTVVDTSAQHNISTDQSLIKEVMNLSVDFFSRKTKKKSVRKKIKRSKNIYDAVVKFKPPSQEQIILCCEGNRSKMNLCNIMIKSLGRNDELTRRDITMSTMTQKNKIGGKKITIKWYRASISSVDSKSKPVIYSVRDDHALVPLGIKTRTFKNKIFFSTFDQAKEYVLMNYIIDFHIHFLSNCFKNNNELQTFTITHRDRLQNYKQSMFPHYGCVSYDENYFIFFAIDDNMTVSKLKQHWRTVPKLTHKRQNTCK
jgi:hypothetical protein